jgi:predicted nucleic acid-binding protein
MILVDAGVLIDYLRTKDPKLDHLFRSRQAAICGATRSEILAGSRSAQDRQRLLRFLRPFQRVPIREAVWDTVGVNLAALYASGITIPFPDVIVATLGIENDLEVWARDPHFSAMQKILPKLKLFAEPP